MLYENILIAVDGSEEALFAFKKAIEVAKRNNGRLIVAHVIELSTYLEVNAFQVNITDSMVEYATNLLAEYKKIALESGLEKVDTVLEYGDPRTVIPKKIAKAENCDLIICGATGLNAVERFFIGSVSESITRRAKCDVLVMRDKEKSYKKEKEKSKAQNS